MCNNSSMCNKTSMYNNSIYNDTNNNIYNTISESVWSRCMLQVLFLTRNATPDRVILDPTCCVAEILSFVCNCQNSPLG